jgi:hypothetical protein
MDWDMYRPTRFVKSAILIFREVSIKEISSSDLEVPKPGCHLAGTVG